MGCGAISGTDDCQNPSSYYQKVKMISSDHQTELWTCRDKVSGKQCFMKVYKELEINQENKLSFQNFKEEISRLKKLHSQPFDQNSASVIDEKPAQHLIKYQTASTDQKNNLVVIFQKHEYKSIQEYLKGKLPGLIDESTAAVYCEQIFKMLKFLRQNGSIFCNLKSSNIYLSNNSKKIILSDYYNLREYFQMPSYNHETSFVTYLAPENTKSKVNFKGTDIWRIGCLVIQLLTCAKPWYSEVTNHETIFQRIKGDKCPPFPQKISTYCRQFLQHCFKIDHHLRSPIDVLEKLAFISRKESSQAKLGFEEAVSVSQSIGSYNVQVDVLEVIPEKVAKIKINASDSKDIEKDMKQLGGQKDSKAKIKAKEVRAKRFTQARVRNDDEPENPQKIKHKNGISRKRCLSVYKPLPQTEQNLQKYNFVKKPLKQKVNHSKNYRLKTTVQQVPTKGFCKVSDAEQILSRYGYEREFRTQKRAVVATKYSGYSYGQQQSPSNSNKQQQDSKGSSNFRISRSKSKMQVNENKLYLNNKPIIHASEQISTRNQQPIQPYSSENTGCTVPMFDPEETCRKMDELIKQIKEEGGQKYFKKPLTLLKRKMNIRKTLKTETSIMTMDDTQHNDDTPQQQYEEQINLQNLDTLDDSYGNAKSSKFTKRDMNDSVHMQADQSRVSFNRQDEIIETSVSKAERQRYQAEKRALDQQRQNQKLRWQQQLQQGRKFIKNQIDNQYYKSRRQYVQFQ